MSFNVPELITFSNVGLCLTVVGHSRRGNNSNNHHKRTVLYNLKKLNLWEPTAFRLQAYLWLIVCRPISVFFYSSGGLFR